MALCVLRKHMVTLLTLIVLVAMAFVLLMFEVTPLAHIIIFQDVFPYLCFVHLLRSEISLCFLCCGLLIFSPCSLWGLRYYGIFYSKTAFEAVCVCVCVVCISVVKNIFFICICKMNKCKWCLPLMQVLVSRTIVWHIFCTYSMNLGCILIHFGSIFAPNSFQRPPCVFIRVLPWPWGSRNLI